MEKKYSIFEIDELREICERKLNRGYYSSEVCSAFGKSSWTPHRDEYKIVEENVRTLMIAGITAKEIIADEIDKNRSRLAERKKRHEDTVASIEASGDRVIWHNREPVGECEMRKRNPELMKRIDDTIKRPSKMADVVKPSEIVPTTEKAKKEEHVVDCYVPKWIKRVFGDK